MELDECKCSLCNYLPVARCLSKGINCDNEILKQILSENPIYIDYISYEYEIKHDNEKKLIDLVVWGAYSTLSLALHFGCGVETIKLILLCDLIKVEGTHTKGAFLLTPLMVAVSSGKCSAETMKLLLGDPRIDTKSHHQSKTFLMCTFTAPFPLPFDTLSVLLSDKRLSIHGKNSYGLTLFTQALQFHGKNPEFVRFILQQPELFSSINDRRGYTTLMIVVESGCSLCVFNMLIADTRIDCMFTCDNITRWVIITTSIMPEVACAILSNPQKFTKFNKPYSSVYPPVEDAIENNSHVSIVKVILNSTPKDHVFKTAMIESIRRSCSTDVIATLMADERVECNNVLHCMAFVYTPLQLTIRTNDVSVTEMILRSNRKFDHDLYDSNCVDNTRMFVTLAQSRTLKNYHNPIPIGKNKPKPNLIDYWRIHRARQMCSLVLQLSRVLAHLSFTPGGRGAVQTEKNWERRVRSRLGDVDDFNKLDVECLPSL